MPTGPEGERGEPIYPTPAPGTNRPAAAAAEKQTGKGGPASGSLPPGRALTYHGGSAGAGKGKEAQGRQSAHAPEGPRDALGSVVLVPAQRPAPLTGLPARANSSLLIAAGGAGPRRSALPLPVSCPRRAVVASGVSAVPAVRPRRCRHGQGLLRRCLETGAGPGTRAGSRAAPQRPPRTGRRGEAGTEPARSQPGGKEPKRVMKGWGRRSGSAGE